MRNLGFARRVLRVVLMASGLAVAYPSAAVAATSNILIEHDVAVGGMVSERFTWYDAAGQLRVAVLAHNNGAAGPGGTYGGELREFRYQTPGGQRVVAASGSGASGFGYVVSHPDGSEACIGGLDSSTLGHFIAGTFTRVFEGRHHAILRFTQNYPRYCAEGGAPAAAINLPVTIDWVIATGRDHPLWAITWDLSAVPVNTLMDDSRAPYGELLFDGSATEAAHSQIAGVGWGDGYKFLSTTDPVTYGSAWTWNTPNTVPYVKLWTSAVDATMGTVQTQTILQQDAGGYYGTNRWNTTSAAGNACTVAIGGVDHLMPCDFNWPYQSINYSLVDNVSPTNNTRLAWGTNFGFLGPATYYTQGSAYWGGPLPNTSAPGWPEKSYSTLVVLGLNSTDPVGAQVAQIENVQNATLTAAVGTVVTTGPAGVNRGDTVTYQPAGWNHVYAGWALRAAPNNQIDANFNVAGLPLSNPLVIVSNWTARALPDSVLLNGVPLAQDVDYFPSLRLGANELWITLNRSLSGAANQLQISTSAPPHRDGDFDADGKADIAVYHSASGLWFIRNSSNQATTSVGYGGPGYIPVPGDYDGDGKVDLAVYNAASGLWFIRSSSTGTDSSTGFGGPGYAPVRGDFDGDGKADLAVYHAASGLWFIQYSSTGTTTSVGFGGSAYQPVPGDYDADGKTDIAVYHPATGLWFIRNSSTLTTTTIGFGGTDYLPVRGVFYGDGHNDVAVFHNPTGLWFIRQAVGGAVLTVGYGAQGYTPIPMDYDGDGQTEIAVYHQPSGLWFIRQTDGSTLTIGYGGAGYVPVF